MEYGHYPIALYVNIIHFYHLVFLMMGIYNILIQIQLIIQLLNMALLIYYIDTLNNKNRRDLFHVIPEIPKPVIEKPSYKTLKL